MGANDQKQRRNTAPRLLMINAWLSDLSLFFFICACIFEHTLLSDSFLLPLSTDSYFISPLYNSLLPPFTFIPFYLYLVGDERRRSSVASGHSGSPAAMQSPSYRERRMSTLSFASDNSLDLPSDMSESDADEDLNALRRGIAEEDSDDDGEDSYASGLSGTAGILRRRSSDEEEAWPTS